MRKPLALVCLLFIIFPASLAFADTSIKGTFGVTGKVGFLVPANNNAESFRNQTDAGVIGGGGVIYGVDDHFAPVFEVTRASFGSQTGDFGVTDLAFGCQFRVLTENDFVPYLEAGVDALLTDYHPDSGRTRKVDNTVGFHLKAGMEYFFRREFSLMGEVGGVFAHNVDVTNNLGLVTGTFDPTNFSTLVGVRYFFR